MGMPLPIRNKRADEIWWDAFIGQPHDVSHNACVAMADMALAAWAARFADHETLADIDANRLAREAAQ